jgi:hypothetical protein
MKEQWTTFHLDGANLLSEQYFQIQVLKDVVSRPVRFIYDLLLWRRQQRRSISHVSVQFHESCCRDLICLWYLLHKQKLLPLLPWRRVGLKAETPCWNGLSGMRSWACEVMVGLMWLQTGFDLMMGFVGLFHTAYDNTLQFTIIHTR